MADRKAERSRVASLGRLTESPGETWALPGLSKASGVNGERGRLGATDPVSSPAPTLPAGCPWASHFAFRSLSFPFWKMGISRVLTLLNHCRVIGDMCIAPGRY